MIANIVSATTIVGIVPTATIITIIMIINNMIIAGADAAATAAGGLNGWCGTFSKQR